MRHCFARGAFLGTTVLAGLTAFSSVTAADEVIMYQEVPSAEEINRVLFGGDTRSVEGQRTRSIRVVEPSARVIQEKTRAIRMHKPDSDADLPTNTGTQTAATEDVAVAEPKGVGLGFNLQFGFDSVELLPESQPYIDRLGEVMGAPENQGKKLLIMGHTDATGSDGYNSVLSEKRAEAVKGYLAATWNISADQLQIEGAGESQPLAGTNPNEGINRRVEFFALN